MCPVLVSSRMTYQAKRFLRSLGWFKDKTPSMSLLDLPEEILECILSYVPSNDVAQLRIVCREMNRICGNTLTVTFKRMIKTVVDGDRVLDCRSSLQSIWNRFMFRLIDSLLVQLEISIGFGIESGECCFFPGSILDQVKMVHKYLKPDIDPMRRRERNKICSEIKILYKLGMSAIQYFDKRFNIKVRYTMRGRNRPYFRQFQLSYISALAGRDIEQNTVIRLLIDNLQLQIYDRRKLVEGYETKQHELPCRFRSALIELLKFNMELQRRGLTYLQRRQLILHGVRPTTISECIARRDKIMLRRKTEERVNLRPIRKCRKKLHGHKNNCVICV